MNFEFVGETSGKGNSPPYFGSAESKAAERPEKLTLTLCLSNVTFWDSKS